MLVTELGATVRASHREQVRRASGSHQDPHDRRGRAESWDNGVVWLPAHRVRGQQGANGWATHQVCRRTWKGSTAALEDEPPAARTGGSRPHGQEPLGALKSELTRGGLPGRPCQLQVTDTQSLNYF